MCVHFGKSKIWHDRGHCWGPCRRWIVLWVRVFSKAIASSSRYLSIWIIQEKKITFTGLRNEQQPDNSIHINQTQYINNIQPISIPRTRRVHPDEPITDDERQSLRGLIDSLQYAAVNSRSDLCSRLGYLQLHINKAKISTLTEANKNTP